MGKQEQIDYINNVDVRTEIANARAAVVRGSATDTQVALVYTCNRMGAALGELESLSGKLRQEMVGIRSILMMALEKKVAPKGKAK